MTRRQGTLALNERASERPQLPSGPHPRTVRDAHRWWSNAVVYQVYVRSFADGNGDGIGDIAGVRSRLPYLHDLGVDAIWLGPWYVSPMADAGYDVADYRNVDPSFGSLADAEQLVVDAHAQGIRVIVDIVPNHTSDRHPWFDAAVAAGPGSPERARYLFRSGRGPGGELPPNNWPSSFGGPAWSRVTEPNGELGEWYLHLFAPEQPDLAWSNPAVRAEFESILRFWLDRGVDGFRIDVARGLVKHPELLDLDGDDEVLRAQLLCGEHPFLDRDEVVDIYRDWRRVADCYAGDRMFVAEAHVASHSRLARYVRGDALHTAFNFDFLMCPWQATSLRQVIEASLDAFRPVNAPVVWVLANHDVPRHVTRYGRPPREWGKRRKSYPMGGPVDLALGLRRARAATLLTLALPGSFYLYQGEELGLPEVEDLPDVARQDPVWERSGHTERGRDGCRVPLPWSGDSPPFGFTSNAQSAAPWLPQPVDWCAVSVSAQELDPQSTLNLYRRAIAIRRTLLSGDDAPLRWIDAPKDVLFFGRGDRLACVVNLSGQPQPLPKHCEVVLASDRIENNEVGVDTAAWVVLA